MRRRGPGPTTLATFARVGVTRGTRVGRTGRYGACVDESSSRPHRMELPARSEERGFSRKSYKAAAWPSTQNRSSLSTPSGASEQGRQLVGRADGLRRCQALKSMGNHAAPDAYFASSRPTNGHLADARTRAATSGPTVGTGGLMQSHAPTIYAYASLAALLEGAEQGGAKSVLSRSIGLPSRKDPPRARQTFRERPLLTQSAGPPAPSMWPTGRHFRRCCRASTAPGRCARGYQRRRVRRTQKRRSRR
jgi:hypothetical protein